MSVTLDAGTLVEEFQRPKHVEFGGVKGCLSTMEIIATSPVILTRQDSKLSHICSKPSESDLRDNYSMRLGYENYPCTRTGR